MKPDILAQFGWSAVVAAVVSWLATRLAERLNIRWKQQQERELERLRAEIAQINTVTNNALSNLSVGYQVSHERRLNAIDGLWATVLELRAQTSSAIFFYDVLLPSEYDEAFTNPKIQAMLPRTSDEERARNLEASDKKVHLLRPYLGEELWLLFFVYRAVLGRICLLLVQGKEKRHIEDWRSDSGVKSLLKVVLSEAEQKQLGVPGFGLHQLTNLLEQKILKKSSRLISGEESAEASIEQAKRLADAAKAAGF